MKSADELRKVNITTGYTKYAAGSVLIEMGDTKVLCTATAEQGVPPFLKGKNKGWVTAEYSMLPSATATRNKRDIASLKQNSRSVEIQRLIGRSLRSAVDLEMLGENTVTVDCDVLQADGGTRTASITGGFVAMALAMKKMLDEGQIYSYPVKNYLAAVSVGIVDDKPVLDLCYEQDSRAQVDMNIVMNDQGRFSEIQGTGEGRTFSKDELSKLLELAEKGIGELIETQRKVLGDIYALPHYEKIKRILIASHNKGKRAELAALLAPLGIEIVSPADIGLEIDPEETGTTFEENALIKARAYCKAAGIAAVADDSGLCIDALNGEPGIYSARYCGDKTFAETSKIILERIKDVPDELRGAHFTCAMAFAAPEGREFCVSGKCFGLISHALMGDKGFGYDPIFYLPEYGKTFGQMSEELKNKISHRAKAAELFFDEIKKYI